jgi:hypothetical protein
MSEANGKRPPVSVVIATTMPWPEIRGAMESVYDQAMALSAEVIVADGHGAGLPSDSAYPGVRHLVVPGASVFELRSRALHAARGDVVAVTEDHCRAAPDWLKRAVQLHREFPRDAVIGGAVFNGAKDHLVDWANFFVSNAPALPPTEPHGLENITGQANVTYKGFTLADYPEDGMAEGEFRRSLEAAGHGLRNDDRLLVDHVQSLGVWETFRIHFDDGRCQGAERARTAAGLGWLRLLALELSWPLRVPVAALRTLGHVLLQKPAFRKPALAATPWIFVLMASHKAGELGGFLTGPGSSAARIR